LYVPGEYIIESNIKSGQSYNNSVRFEIFNANIGSNGTSGLRGTVLIEKGG